jgi:hypothetical protein
MSSRAPTEQQLLEWMESLSNWGRWGQDDQRGTLNLLSPQKTRRALELVQEGVSVSCAHPIIYGCAPDNTRPINYWVLS